MYAWVGGKTNTYSGGWGKQLARVGERSQCVLAQLATLIKLQVSGHRLHHFWTLPRKIILRMHICQCLNRDKMPILNTSFYLYQLWVCTDNVSHNEIQISIS